MARRTLLFSPGDRPEFMRKAPESGADVVVFDLEDAVAPSRKEEARETVVEVLTDPSFDPDCEVCVRVNPGELDADLNALAAADAPRPDAVLLPKAESGGDVERVAGALDDRGLDAVVFALAETAAGVLHAEQVAAAEGLEAIIFGSEDLSADIGASPSESGKEVLYARQHVVLAASAAGVDAIDTVFTDIEDTDGLAAETRDAIDLGYDGKVTIHPSQVPVVNDAFTPDGEDTEWARRVLDAAEEAEREGRGVFRVGDEMIDAPLVARAERVRERARAAGVWDED
jgi:citrate lyase subunit beta/citryl-CoA lyase